MFAQMDKEEGSEDKMPSNHDKSNLFSSKQQDRDFCLEHQFD